MGDISNKIKEAKNLAKKYRDAPRAGWINPGNKARENQAIMVQRTEVIRLAESLERARYGSYTSLFEIIAMQNYMSQLAEGEPGALMCKIHKLYFLHGWMDGKCPYCEAEKEANDMVENIMEGLEPHDTGTTWEDGCGTGHCRVCHSNSCHITWKQNRT